MNTNPMESEMQMEMDMACNGTTETNVGRHPLLVAAGFTPEEIEAYDREVRRMHNTPRYIVERPNELSLLAHAPSEVKRSDPHFEWWFKDRHMVVILRSDRAEQVARVLHGVAREVRIVELDLVHGDVGQWLEQGHTAEELEALAEAVPVWSPPNKKRRPKTKGRRRERHVAEPVTAPDAPPLAPTAPSIWDVLETRRCERRA
jgi:hypothetical protein